MNILKCITFYNMLTWLIFWWIQCLIKYDSYTKVYYKVKNYNKVNLANVEKKHPSATIIFVHIVEGEIVKVKVRKEIPNHTSSTEQNKHPNWTLQIKVTTTEVDPVKRHQQHNPTYTHWWRVQQHALHRPTNSDHHFAWPVLETAAVLEGNGHCHPQCWKNQQR